MKMILSAKEVLSTTEIGRTRFHYDPHLTNGKGVRYWSQLTQLLNRKWLSSRIVESQPGLSLTIKSAREPAPRPGKFSTRQITTPTLNRATRGSRRQLQDYVNERPDILSQAILDVLPSRLGELRASIRWVSPLAHKNYEEYRDGEFLKVLGTTDEAARLAEFWPSVGPCWDALGVISDPRGRLKPGAVLVEAKSHINEIYGNGCQASLSSLGKIERALRETREWLRVEGDAEWLGPLYQYANRLAHLYFLLKKVNRPAWLVNLYFLNDSIGPTTQAEWQSEIRNVKASLRLPQDLPNAVNVFLPALSVTIGVAAPPIIMADTDQAPVAGKPNLPVSPLPEARPTSDRAAALDEREDICCEEKA